jgi:hypothetical protein
MQLRMLLRPTMLPFLRVRGVNGNHARRGGPFAAKSQAGARGIAATKPRRFLA